MKKPIQDPKFWRQRLYDTARSDRHKAVFCCTADHWQKVNDLHHAYLLKHIHPQHSILDLGCGWGRLLDILPPCKDYTGIDLTPDFIALAKMERPKHKFICGTFADVLPTFAEKQFDVGVMVSIRGMIIREQGQDVWEENRKLMDRVCKNLLYLEYGLTDPEEFVQCL